MFNRYKKRLLELEQRNTELQNIILDIRAQESSLNQLFKTNCFYDFKKTIEELGGTLRFFDANKGFCIRKGGYMITINKNDNIVKLTDENHKNLITLDLDCIDSLKRLYAQSCDKYNKDFDRYAIKTLIKD